MRIGLHVGYSLFFSDFTETWNFVDRFWKNTQILYFIKIRPVVTELFHANWRTERRKYIHTYIHTHTHTHTHTTKLIVAFCNFLNARNKKLRWLCVSVFVTVVDTMGCRISKRCPYNLIRFVHTEVVLTCSPSVMFQWHQINNILNDCDLLSRSLGIIVFICLEVFASTEFN
jgi:hypothetical protein